MPAEAATRPTMRYVEIKSEAQLEVQMQRAVQRQSSEPQRDQSMRFRQRGYEGRSSRSAMADLAEVPCTSRLSTGRPRSRASEALHGCAAHPRAGSRNSFFG